MNKTIKPKQPSQDGARASQIQVLAQETSYHGPIPHPSDLERYEAVLPGAADRLISMAEEESKHRQKQEAEILQANIRAQQRQFDLAESRTKATSYSDTLGQALGAIVSLASIAGCVYLALAGQPWVALGLVGLPLAGVIKALRSHPRPDTSRPSPPAK